MIKFGLAPLSKFRKELMGFSAILILICHAKGNGIDMPKYLSYFLAQGQIGVDIFLFLSGMGLWYSLSKSVVGDDGLFIKESLFQWYWNRFLRILVPYLMIMIPMTTIQCITDGGTLMLWFSKISTIEFWISHRASWFIALLIPLYLLSPCIFCLFRKHGIIWFFLFVMLCYFFALLPSGSKEWTLFRNIQFAIIRVPAFLFGFYLAPMIKNNAQINIYCLFCMLIGTCIMIVLCRKPVYSYLFLILPLMLLVCNSFFYRESGNYKKVCSFFGKISLESYLWNTTLAVIVVPLYEYFNIPDYNNIGRYLFIIIWGTGLSVWVNNIAQPITKRNRK